MATDYYLPEEKEKIILDNQGLVHHILNKHFDLPKAVYEDCFQEGILAMMIALERYDSSKKTKFVSFAYPYIYGTVLKYIKSQAPSLKYPTRMLDTRAKVTALMEDGLTQEEICKALGLTDFQYSEIIKIGETVSLNAVAHVGPDGSDVNYEDVVRDSNDSIENYVSKDTIMGILQILMPKINVKDRSIYLEYIESIIAGEPCKHKSIAKKHKCEVSRVTSIIKKYNRLLKAIAKKEDFI